MNADATPGPPGSPTPAPTPAQWATQLRELARSGLANTPAAEWIYDPRAGDPTSRAKYVLAFRDDAGHRRAVDTPLLARVLQVRTPRPSGALSPDVTLWWSLLDTSGDVAALLAPEAAGGAPCPLLPETEPKSAGWAGASSWAAIEPATEAELSALQAVWNLARERRDTALRERALRSAAWLIEHIQPDNATQHPWGVPVFVALSLAAAREADQRAAAHYAQTLVHNSVVGRGVPDRFSAFVLLDAADALRAM